MSAIGSSSNHNLQQVQSINFGNDKKLAVLRSIVKVCEQGIKAPSRTLLNKFFIFSRIEQTISKMSTTSPVADKEEKQKFVFSKNHWERDAKTNQLLIKHFPDIQRFPIKQDSDHYFQRILCFKHIRNLDPKLAQNKLSELFNNPKQLKEHEVLIQLLLKAGAKSSRLMINYAVISPLSFKTIELLFANYSEAIQQSSPIKISDTDLFVACLRSLRALTLFFQKFKTFKAKDKHIEEVILLCHQKTLDQNKAIQIIDILCKNGAKISMAHAKLCLPYQLKTLFMYLAN